MPHKTQHREATATDTVGSGEEARDFDISNQLKIQCLFDPAVRAPVSCEAAHLCCVQTSTYKLYMFCISVSVQAVCMYVFAAASSQNRHQLIAYNKHPSQGIFSEAFDMSDGLAACGFDTLEAGTWTIQYEVRACISLKKAGPVFV